jgi:uncharacterized C2H2 Zn-finger protein
MDKGTAALILAYVQTPCPLCDEKFRTRTILRLHLKKSHTELEAEKYMRKERKMYHKNTIS